MIQAGEATGHLAPVLAKVIQYLEEKQAIRKKNAFEYGIPELCHFSSPIGGCFIFNCITTTN
ncbi:MAG: hypothetical protein ACJZ9L_00625 [Coraliomargaritaceae bacterium]